MFPLQDWPAAWHDLSRLLISYLLALPVGWYREREAHTIGVRTFPLVAVAACGYVLLAAGDRADVAAQSRIIQGLVTGIGFIGGGAILRAGRSVHGTATAASIWSTGALGAAVAVDRFYMALMLSILSLITLRVLLPIKEKLDQHRGHPDI